jgi:hypothetical protein
MLITLQSSGYTPPCILNITLLISIREISCGHDRRTPFKCFTKNRMLLKKENISPGTTNGY